MTVQIKILENILGREDLAGHNILVGGSVDSLN
jgi:hypothetical protein